MSPTARARRAAFAAVAVALLALAPAATAAPKPAIYFLRDTAFPAGTPAIPAASGIPMAPGELVTLVPPGLPPVNASDPAGLPATAIQTKAPQTRLIFPGQEVALPVTFGSNASAGTGRIYGPILTLLFLPKTPLVQHGNLTVQLVVLPPGAAATDVPPRGEVVASASFSMDVGNSTFLPNGTAMVPPDPTDPQAALAYIQGQLLAYGLTQLASSYKVVFLLNETRSFIIDKAVEEGSTVQLRLALEPGSSPVPVAVAAGQPLAYWNALTPSFVYVPWYAADPPQKTPTSTKAPSPTGTPGTFSRSGTEGPTGTSSAPGGGGKKTPGLEVPLAVAGLAVLALAARRRLR